MISFKDIPEIYIVCGVTDLRKGIDGYALIVQSTLKLDPFKDSLYIFCNRHHNKIKCLYWDGTGYWLLYKRLEKGHFKWKNNPDGSISITHQQLEWMLQGLKIDQKNYLKKLDVKYV